MVAPPQSVSEGCPEMRVHDGMRKGGYKQIFSHTLRIGFGGVRGLSWVGHFGRWSEDGFILLSDLCPLHLFQFFFRSVGVQTCSVRWFFLLESEE